MLVCLLAYLLFDFSLFVAMVGFTPLINWVAPNSREETLNYYLKFL